FQHIRRGDGVLLQVLARVLGAKTDVGVGGEVEDEVAAHHGLRQSRPVEVIAHEEAEVRVAQGVGQEGALAGREVVPADDRSPVAQQPIAQGAADEPCRPGHEDALHRAPFRGRSVSPITRLQKTSGSGNGKNLRPTISKWTFSSRWISAGRLMCSREMNHLYDW